MPTHHIVKSIMFLLVNKSEVSYCIHEINKKRVSLSCIANIQALDLACAKCIFQEDQFTIKKHRHAFSTISLDLAQIKKIITFCLGDSTTIL